MGEETSPKTEGGGHKQYMAEAEFAQGILEELLTEADEAHREANKAWDDEIRPPFRIERHPQPPEFAPPDSTINLHYKLKGEEWDETQDDALEALHSWLAFLQLPFTYVAHEVYSRCNNLLEELLSTNNVTDKAGDRRPLSAVTSLDLRKKLLEVIPKLVDK